MGGISIPAHSAGLLAPCADDDQPAQVGPWTTSYTSAPFAHPQAAAGPITATIYASSTTTETQLVAELEDVPPSGSSYPLTEGALLGSLRAVDQADTPHLTPLPQQLPELAGGVYTIDHAAAAPSSLTLELLG
jgi:uncharacterized protein